VRHRDELVDELVAGRRRGLFRYFGQVAAGEYAVEVDLPGGTTVRRQHDVAGMSAWLDGFTAGRGLPDRALVIRQGARVSEPVRTLLTNPSVVDQRRIRVAHAMERRGWTYADVAGQLGAQRSTVRDLLAYGREPARVTARSRHLAEVEALLPELRRQYGPRPRPRTAPVPERVESLSDADWPEPAEMRRARALALAVEAGIVTEWSPIDVGALRAARVVRLVDVGAGGGRDGDDVHTVAVATVIPWLQGFADGAATAGTGWEDYEHAQVIMLAHALA
jgi:hypothetical protein